jgi:hypothetical protein
MQETAIQEVQQPLSCLPVLYKDNVTAVQYDPGQEVNQLLSILKESETSDAYQKVAEKTWMFLKRLIVLILFTISLVFALLVWVYGTGFQAGYHFRKWLEEEQPPIEKITSQILDYLSWPFKKAYEWAEKFVEDYLHWKVSFDKSPSQTDHAASQTTAVSIVRETKPQ